MANRPETASALLMAAVACLCAAAAGSSARAQQLIGYVSTKDAEVSGSPDVIKGQAVLVGSVSVTAKDHTATITVGRGGIVRVCQTSVLHLTKSHATSTIDEFAAPLLLSLDRGAVEVQMPSTPTDTLMTPDLRFTVKTGGPLNLRVRVARNGDTCVDNRGPGAPTLAISDPFGGTSYQLNSGQHVLFEHGSLREVVDHEASSCGCPEPGAGGGDGKHPFPAAVSEGLAPAAEVPQAAPGEVHTQVSETMVYNAGQPPAPASSSAAAATPVAPASAGAPAPKRNFFQSVGHFFKRLFGG